MVLVNTQEIVFEKSIFIVSIDVELLWGFVCYPEHKFVKLLKNDKEACRGKIDFLLKLFEKLNIKATWAIVGHLFLDNCKKINGIPHIDMPRYKDKWYDFDPCSNINKDALFYGKDIIENILSSPVKHEIGYHTFSHVPFTKCNQEVAEAEIKKGIALAKEMGIIFKSFVFPENEIAHLNVLSKYGFEIYRGKRTSLGFYNFKQNILLRKFNAAIDKIISLPVEPKWKKEGIWEIPSSMSFYDPQFPQLVLPKAKLGLSAAICLNKVFHINFHPWNLLVYDSMRRDLEKFLELVAKKRDKKKLIIFTMGELALYLNSRGLDNVQTKNINLCSEYKI